MVKSDIDNREYISGGILTFGIATALIMIIDYFFPMISETEGFFLLRLFQGLLVYIFTTAAVGFYVARRALDKHIEVSVKTGYFAFLMNIALMLYYRTFFGALWILVGYLIGGIIGGLAARYLSKNEMRLASEET
jgi:hypothetical protein